MLMGLFLLPESLAEDRRRPFDWRRANPIGSLRQLGRLGGSLRGFAIVYFLWMLAIQSLHGIWSYVTAYRYQWSPLEIGLSLTTVGVLAVIVNGLIVKRMVAQVGEWRTAVVGITAGTLSYLVYLIAEAPALAYLGLFVGALGGVTVPALQALMTRSAGSDSQGELQGALATLSALTVISGPLVFARVFTFFSGADAPIHAPGAPFLLSALLAGLALLMLQTLKPAPQPAA
jgi:DHA1 family tetracycline resistance protein-like MFS transporter